MADRDLNRERRGRETETDNDWDWDYYYEYRYIPYSPYRKNIYDRNSYGRDFDRDYDYNYGRYSGVGPRGYQRSDERIADDVNDRLTWHGHVDASDIEVEVSDGVVTLTGSVDSRYEKRLSEDIAESVSGVWDIHNQLNVRNRGWGRSSGEMTGRQIRPGMEVIGKDGGNVGEVKEVRSNDFLVDRSLARDVYVPFNACQTTTDGRIHLNVRADEVDAQDWEMPELFETESTQKSQKKR